MRKREVGIVTSDGADKTRRVEVERVLAHAKYGKTIRRRTVCHVHDEENVSKLGDRVEIVESRPLSRLKRWRLVKVL
jgi:small subunit ribosomal protein S17